MGWSGVQLGLGRTLPRSNGEMTLNAIQLSSGDFDGLPKVVFLDISYCGLRSLLTGMFDPLENLEELRINDNYLNVLPPCIFHKLGKLQVLRFERNYIKQLPIGFLSQSPNIRKLYVDEELFKNGINPTLCGLLSHVNALSNLRANYKRTVVNLKGKCRMTLPLSFCAPTCSANGRIFCEPLTMDVKSNDGISGKFYYHENLVQSFAAAKRTCKANFGYLPTMQFSSQLGNWLSTNDIQRSAWLDSMGVNGASYVAFPSPDGAPHNALASPKEGHSVVCLKNFDAWVPLVFLNYKLTLNLVWPVTFQDAGKHCHFYIPGTRDFTYTEAALNALAKYARDFLHQSEIKFWMQSPRRSPRYFESTGNTGAYSVKRDVTPGMLAYAVCVGNL